MRFETVIWGQVRRGWMKVWGVAVHWTLSSQQQAYSHGVNPELLAVSQFFERLSLFSACDLRTYRSLSQSVSSAVRFVSQTQL